MKGKTTTPSFTHDQVREALDYNPVTGVFLWKVNPAKNVKAGTRAGGGSQDGGYRYIRLFGEEITESRLAWFYMRGEWPERRVRYVNGNRFDCRFENLTLFNGVGGEFDHKTEEGRLAYQKVYRSLTPHLQKARALRDSFDISVEQFTEMLEKQNGVCAICGSPETHERNGKVKALAVDHNHETGKIRGLLCSDCNTGIGKLKDSPTVLRAAAQYIETYSEPDVISKGDFQ